MQQNTYELLRDQFHIDERILALIEESESRVSSQFETLDDIKQA